MIHIILRILWPYAIREFKAAIIIQFRFVPPSDSFFFESLSPNPYISGPNCPSASCISLPKSPSRWLSHLNFLPCTTKFFLHSSRQDVQYELFSETGFQDFNNFRYIMYCPCVVLNTLFPKTLNFTLSWCVFGRDDESIFLPSHTST